MGPNGEIAGSVSGMMVLARGPIPASPSFEKVLTLGLVRSLRKNSMTRGLQIFKVMFWPVRIREICAILMQVFFNERCTEKE